MTDKLSMDSDLVLHFLELYQAESCIWDPQNKCHKNKQKVNDAWGRISDEIKIPITILKKKKEALMATFRQQLRKKKASMKSGAGASEIYKPVWFAYQTMESFLLPVYTASDSINTEEGPDEEQVHEEQSNLLSQELLPRTSDETLALSPLAKKPRRGRSQPPQLERAEQQMKAAFSSLNEALKRKEDDECDLYGQLLAKKLRKIPEDERAGIMYEIDGIFMKRYSHSSSSKSTTPASVNEDL